MSNQHQRRWLILDQALFLINLEQADGYQFNDLTDWFLGINPEDPFNYARIRRSNNTNPTMTIKRRNESSGERSIASCSLMGNVDGILRVIGECNISKRRYLLSHGSAVGGKMTLDVYTHPNGLSILELNDPSPHAPEAAIFDEIPAWIRACGLRDVTNSLSSAHIANLPSFNHAGDLFEHVHSHVAADMPMIVITGGPCSGKTTMLNELAKDPRFLVVPEVATILITYLGIKPFGASGQSEQFQAAVRRVQTTFENLARVQAHADQKIAVILDRGVLDACAYIPGGMRGYSELFGIVALHDGARYRGVVQLPVPDEDVYNRCRGNNKARSESHAQAAALGGRIHTAWKDHPNYVEVKATELDEKISEAVAAINKLLS